MQQLWRVGSKYFESKQDAKILDLKDKEREDDRIKKDRAADLKKRLKIRK